ncbi:hypothetical protein IGI04_030411, partial [Brassica rapa subsp. trilocularis]
EGDVGLLEDYVASEDIPFIRSLTISSAHRRDTFCWNYTKNDQYTVKSGDIIDDPQVLSLGNICMIDGLWTSTSQFSGCGWAWIDSLGKVQLMGTRNYIR